MSEPDRPSAEEEFLELGRERSAAVSRLATRVRGLRYVAAATACVGLTVATVVALHPGAAVVGAGRLALPQHHSSPAAPPAPVSHAYDGPIRAVQALAGHRGPLPSYVRQTSPAGACALVSPGHSPRRRAQRALARVAPRFRLRDGAVVLDQFTGLCAVQLRADNVAGAVLVVSVASPAGMRDRRAYDQVQTGFELAPQSATKYAAVTTRRGFTVLVGATGPDRSLPTDRQLIDLAHDPALTW